LLERGLERQEIRDVGKGEIRQFYNREINTENRNYNKKEKRELIIRKMKFGEKKKAKVQKRKENVQNKNASTSTYLVRVTMRKNYYLGLHIRSIRYEIQVSSCVKYLIIYCGFNCKTFCSMQKANARTDGKNRV